MSWYDSDQNNAKGEVQAAGKKTCLRSSHASVQSVLCFGGFFCLVFFLFFSFFFLALPQRFKQFMACGHVLSLGSDQVLNFP